MHHFIAQQDGETCDDVCRSHGHVCSDTNHGLSDPSNVLEIFKRAGINCTSHEYSNDYMFYTDPSYIATGFEKGICRGITDVPQRIACGGETKAGLRRLCPCKAPGNVLFYFVKDNKLTNAEKIIVDHGRTNWLRSSANFKMSIQSCLICSMLNKL